MVNTCWVFGYIDWLSCWFLGFHPLELSSFHDFFLITTRSTTAAITIASTKISPTPEPPYFLPPLFPPPLLSKSSFYLNSWSYKVIVWFPSLSKSCDCFDVQVPSLIPRSEKCIRVALPFKKKIKKKRKKRIEKKEKKRRTCFSSRILFPFLVLLWLLV